MAAVTVDEDRAQPERASAFDVLRRRVADHRSLVRADAEPVERRLEDRRMRLHPSVRAGVDDRIDVEAVMRDELREVANSIRDEPELERMRAQFVQHRQDVLVELEVLGSLPAALDLGRARRGDLVRPAQADEDVLGKGVPDRLVVHELRMTLQIERRRLTRLVVPGHVQLDAVSRRDACVALGRQLRPRTAEREVDVEQDRAQRHTRAAGHLYASGWRFASDGSFARIARSCARSSSAVTTVSTSGACARTVPHGSATSERP